MDNIVLITNWNELKECVSKTHRLEIETDCGSGRIVDKETNESIYYLSTHTFYASNYEHATKLLQSCGFNVELSNWDK